jgi:type IV secretion system protein VirD4
VDRQGTAAGSDVVLVAIGGLLLGTAGVVWGGAWLAAAFSGGSMTGGLSGAFDALHGLVSSPGDPSEAWGDAAVGLPGPWLYWSCTAFVAAAAIAVVVGMVGLWRRWVTPSRARLGVSAEARVARRRDVAPLVVSSTVPPTGRLLLGRQAPHGPLLATEDRERHPMRGRRGSMIQGDRGSVALIGPTRSGKTVLASAGIIGWDGPVVALSVKRDLYDATAAARSARGELAVFDPGGVTGLPTARWTPLREVTTTSGALRAGRALAAAIPRQGVTGGDFWATHGETLTSAYMCLAGLSHLLADQECDAERLSIGRLASWAYMHVGLTEPTVNSLVRQGLAAGQPLEIRLLAKDAVTKLMAFEQEDPRIRASIYATARLAFDAWTEPSVSHSASLDPRDTYSSDELWDCTPRYVDLDWLMDGDEGRSNTLYLTAPATEFARLAPVLGGLLGDLREQIHAWDIAGRRLSKPLLIVIDEAGQLELRWLPEEVSTIAGLGGMFITGWQSRAQINHRYGSLADAVLGGHRSKVIFNGTDDLSTLEYVTKVAGTEHVAQRGWSADTGGVRRTVSEHLQRDDLLPAHVIRQMRRQEAVLLHGTLPPIHLRTVRWWEDKALAALVPTGDDGKPVGPPTTGTCPTRPGRHESVDAAIDPVVIEESVRRIPVSHGNSATTHLPDAADLMVLPLEPEQLELPLSSHQADDAEQTVGAGSSSRSCCRCGSAIPAGEGRTLPVGVEVILLCSPRCQLPSRT